MKIEHFAYNVAEPQALAAWYVEHFGLSIVRHIPQPAQTHFLSDGAGTIIEIYCNPPDKVPNYREMDPLQFHFAFVSTDPGADSARLCKAGASIVVDQNLPDGSRLMMLRDPWGIAFQLCKRAKSLT
jgi:glyoxylase I family protein